MVSINIFKPLSTFLKATRSINLSNTRQFFSTEIFWGTLGIEPVAAGSGSKYANHCTTLPPPLPQIKSSCTAFGMKLVFIKSKIEAILTNLRSSLCITFSAVLLRFFWPVRPPRIATVGSLCRTGGRESNQVVQQGVRLESWDWSHHHRNETKPHGNYNCLMSDYKGFYNLNS